MRGKILLHLYINFNTKIIVMLKKNALSTAVISCLSVIILNLLFCYPVYSQQQITYALTEKYDANLATWKEYSKIENSYDAQGRIINSKEFNQEFNFGGWRLKSEYEYAYNGENQLDNLKETQYAGDKIDYFVINEYGYYPNGQPKFWIEKSYPDSIFSYANSEYYTYYENGNKYKTYYYDTPVIASLDDYCSYQIYIESPGLNQEKYTYHFDLPDGQGNVVHFSTKVNLTYDESGRIIYRYSIQEQIKDEYLFEILTNEEQKYEIREQKIKVRNSDFSTDFRDSTQFFYNDENLLIGKKQHQLVGADRELPELLWGLDLAYKYEYFCDERLKREYLEVSNPAIISNFRTTYHYLNGVNCKNDQLDATLHIYPNPTTQKVQIESDLLADEQAKVRVFSTLGEVVFQQDIPAGTHLFEFELNNLPRGYYSVVVSSEKRVTTQRLLFWGQ